MRHLTAPFLQEVADRVFAYVQPDGGWCLSNAGIVTDDGGPLLIDTAATERRARGLRSIVDSLSDLPPRLLVNTHHHGDHTYGNGYFPEACVIGHELCRTEMVAAGLQLGLIWPHVDWGAIEVVPPAVTFTDRLTLWLGERRVELIHVGPAHTSNDVVAWLPEERVLFAGDVVFSAVTPFVMMGSVAGSLAALDLLRALDAEVVVGGHGAVGGPELLAANESYLRFLQGVAREGYAAGLPPLALARETDLGEFSGLLDSERLVGNLHRAYSEERGEPLGTPLEYLTVMLEMADYNGGEPPTCLA
jgi:cyclase